MGIGPEMNIIERRETFGWILNGINVYILHNKREFILRACRHRELYRKGGYDSVREL